MTSKKFIPSNLEGVAQYLFILLLLVLCVLGLKYVISFLNYRYQMKLFEPLVGDKEKLKEEEDEEDGKGDGKKGELIPKRIIQTWKNKNIPDKYQNLQKQLINKNPNYEYLFFSDEDIEKFLKTEYPEYYVTFRRLPILIQKIDFFRYIAVYHYGGFYFDLDMECMESLDDEILKHNTVIPIDDKFAQSKKDLNRHWMDYQGNEKVILGQYAFGGVKNSSFMKYLADNIHSNIELIIKEYDIKVKNNISNFEYFVYGTTGPDYVTYMYKSYYPKWEVFILDYPRRQYFGKYARHRYFGTWKNNTNN
jgi:hypothetical protein